MSQLCKENIICPKCQAKSEYEYWASVNVELNPELKEKIFNEEIFVWICPHCEAKVFITNGMVYHDMSHKFMILFSHKEDEEKAYDMWAVPDFDLYEGYALRIVEGLREFKEKIWILENELNDIAIEKLKYTMTHYTYPSLAEKRCQLHFKGITKPDDDNKYGQIRFYHLSPDEEPIGELALPMEEYYEQCLSLQLDKRFDVNMIACVDERWIANKIKEL